MKKLGQVLKQKFMNAPVGAKLRLIYIGFVAVSVGVAIGADISISMAIVFGTLLFAATVYVYALARRARLNRGRVGSKT